jgi:TolB-like protein
MVPAPAPAATDDEARRVARKKDKVRSAWISFVGRILAQLVGATATVVLGLMLAKRVYPPDRTPDRPSPAPPAPAAGVAAPVRSGVSVAVLPFVNISGEAPQDVLADAMTEAVISDLAKGSALRVVSRTSAMRYKGQAKALPEIARELGVSAVVEGSVVSAGGRVRVTAQLIDAGTDQHLWAQSYDRELKDVLALQEELARAIARAVEGTLAPR